MLRFTFLAPDSMGLENNSLKFIEEELRVESEDAVPQADDEITQSEITGLVRQQHVVSYPLLAYNGYLPDNSELVVTNMAEREKRPQLIQLGQWRFVSFVESACMSGVLPVEELNSQIFFLAYHSDRNKLRLMMLDHDPWSAEKLWTLHVLQSGDIQALPCSVRDLRHAHLLAQADSMSLVLQFTDHLWHVPLKNPQAAEDVFEGEARKMKQRSVVRRAQDRAHLYAIALQGSRSEVVKIGLDREPGCEKLLLEAVYESANASVILLEPDLESAKHLFIVDDQQHVIKLYDEGEGKADVVRAVDLQGHDLDGELDLLETQPFSSATISNRLLTILDISFSQSSKLYWSAKSGDGRQLRSDRNLSGTLCSLQLWHLDDGTNVVSLKPLAGSCFVDLLGQNRPTQKMLVYLVSESRVLVQTSDKRMLVFDKEGYICYDVVPGELQEAQPEIMKLSTNSPDFGRFILLKSAEHDKTYLSLVQSDQIGFSQIFKRVSDSRIRKLVARNLDADSLIEKLNLGRADDLQQLKQQVEKSLKATLKTHVNHAQVSQKGEVLVPATVVIERLSRRQTIFQREVDESSEARFGLKRPVFGMFQYNLITVILFVCATRR